MTVPPSPSSPNRRRFLRRATGLLGAGAATALLAACSSPPAASPAAPAAKSDAKPADSKPAAAPPTAPAQQAAPAAKAGGPVTLRVLTPSFPQDTGKKVFEEIVAEFNKAEPNVKFEVEYLPNFGNLNERLSTNFAAGTPPDVFMIGHGWIEAFASKGQLLPIGDRVDKAELDDFYPVLLEGGTYRGTLYSLPIQLDTRIMLYNKAHFSEAGLDPERPPTSWDQLKEMAVKLTKRGSDGSLVQAGFDPLGGANAQPRQHFFRFLWQNGGRLFDEQLSESLAAAPATVEALEWYTDLIRGQKVYDMDFVTGVPTVTLLGSGKASIASVHNDIWRELQQDPEHAKKFGVVPPLTHKAHGEFMGGNFVVIAKATKHPDEAWSFMRHLTSKEMTLKGDVVRGAVPPRKSLQQSDYVKNNWVLSAAMNQLPVSKREGGPPSWLEIRSLWDPALVEALQGQKPPKQAMEDLARKSNEILKRAG